MSKRKPMDKAQARERRNRLLESAAAADLSLTDGVREMRAIAGMTQEEFARHREVSARVIKAIELGQGNPTVATLNRIGQFFGLEVAFVPVRRTPVAAEQVQPVAVTTGSSTSPPLLTTEDLRKAAAELQERINAGMRLLSATYDTLDKVEPRHEKVTDTPGSPPWDSGRDNAPAPPKKKPRSR